jgi:ribonuclease HI
MLSGRHKKEHAEGFAKTTNNRMELMAVIRALELIKIPPSDCDITVYSDSKYVVDSIEKGWVFGWQKKGFKNKKNPDLWQAYLRLHKDFKPRFVWVKGHNNHPENERCDTLAVKAAEGENLPPDIGFAG